MFDESIFGDIDLKNASEDPFYKENDTYLCQITEAPITASAKGNRGLNIKYTIQKGDHEGEPIRDYLAIPKKWEVKGYPTESDLDSDTNYDKDLEKRSKRSVGFLKKRLLEFGFANEELDSIQPEDILAVGLLWVTLRHRKSDNQEQVAGVKLAEDSEGTPFD